MRYLLPATKSSNNFSGGLVLVANWSIKSILSLLSVKQTGATDHFSQTNELSTHQNKKIILIKYKLPPQKNHAYRTTVFYESVRLQCLVADWFEAKNGTCENVSAGWKYLACSIASRGFTINSNWVHWWTNNDQLSILLVASPMRRKSSLVTTNKFLVFLESLSDTTL